MFIDFPLQCVEVFVGGDEQQDRPIVKQIFNVSIRIFVIICYFVNTRDRSCSSPSSTKELHRQWMAPTEHSF